MWACGSMYCMVMRDAWSVNRDASVLARPGAAGGFSGGGGNGLGCRITESQQDLFRLVRLRLHYLRERFAKGSHPEVFLALGMLDPVNKRGQIDQLAAGIHEIQIENLLACHSGINIPRVCPPAILESSKNQDPGKHQTSSSKMSCRGRRFGAWFMGIFSVHHPPQNLLRRCLRRCAEHVVIGPPDDFVFSQRGTVFS